MKILPVDFIEAWKEAKMSNSNIIQGADFSKPELKEFTVLFVRKTDCTIKVWAEDKDEAWSKVENGDIGLEELVTFTEENEECLVDSVENS